MFDDFYARQDAELADAEEQRLLRGMCPQESEEDADDVKEGY